MGIDAICTAGWGKSPLLSNNLAAELSPAILPGEERSIDELQRGDELFATSTPKAGLALVFAGNGCESDG